MNQGERRLWRGRRPDPHARSTVVVRAPVAQRLAATEGRLVLVTAPAGYGKTTQIAQWAAEDGRQVAWADLEVEDNDPVALLSVLVEMLSDVEGFSADGIPNAMPRADGVAAAVPALGAAVQRCQVPFVLVLDEVNHVDAEPAVALLDALAWAVPEGSTVVFIGRSEPRRSLARLRAHRGVVEVTTDDLALDVGDARRVLAGMDVHLDDDVVERLVAETEGWMVGLRLAGSAHRRRLERSASIDDGVGDLDRAADYVHEEWLRGLASADVDFLRNLAMLEWLSAPLCDHVLDRSGSGDVLRRIHDNRLLVTPLDRRLHSYRMHRLLREVLKAELEEIDPDASWQHHARASEWFEAHGDIDRAIRHAFEAENLARAEQLVIDHTAAFQTTGRYATVARWLDSFPEGYVTARPSLGLMAAVVALGMGDGEGAGMWVRFASAALAAAPDPLTARRLDGFASLIDSTSIPDALAAARRAHDGLAPGIWHANACLALGAWSFVVGDETAAAALTEGAAEAHISGAFSLEANAHAHLAVIHGWAGHWDRAIACARLARELVHRRGLDTMPTLVLVTAMAALVEAMEGDSGAARANWVLTRRNLELYGTVASWANVQARIALARASLLLDDQATGRALLDEAEAHLHAQPEAIRPRAQVAALRGLLSAGPPVGVSEIGALTEAELRVLHYLPTHLTFPEIAALLFVSRHTVKSHVASIYRKLDAASRKDAVDIARATGLLMGA